MLLVKDSHRLAQILEEETTSTYCCGTYMLRLKKFFEVMLKDNLLLPSIILDL